MTICKASILLNMELKKYMKKKIGVRKTSECLWYKEGEKSSKFFLNLEKRRGIQDKIRKLIINSQEIVHQNKIQNELLFFYETLFRNVSASTSEDCERFLNEVYEVARICEGDLNELELLEACKPMQNN